VRLFVLVPDFRHVRCVRELAHQSLVLALRLVKVEACSVGCPEAAVKAHREVSLSVLAELGLRNKAADIVGVAFWIEDSVVRCLVVLLMFASLFEGNVGPPLSVEGLLRGLGQGCESSVGLGLSRALISFTNLNVGFLHLSLNQFSVRRHSAELGRSVDATLIHRLGLQLTAL